MANKNTKRRRKLADRKSGHAVKSDNGGKWKPVLSAQMKKDIDRIREESIRVYGRSA